MADKMTPAEQKIDDGMRSMLAGIVPLIDLLSDGNSYLATSCGLMIGLEIGMKVAVDDIVAARALLAWSDHAIGGGFGPTQARADALRALVR
jgi:hypothetical protein